MIKIALVAVDIRSAHNVGSLFRTCDGFGASLILCGITPRPKGNNKDERLPYVIEKAHKAIIKTALGAENTVKWRYYKNTEEALNHLKNEKFSVIAIEQDKGSENISKMTLDKNTALVLGPEVKGLDKNTLKLCDQIYEIPMLGKKESFNVSVSAGIALFVARNPQVYKL